MKKLLFLTLLSTFILSAFGGKGGSASAVNADTQDLTPECIEFKNCTDNEIEEIFELPVLPTKEDDYAYIKGIDYDGDGVGDIAQHMIFKALPYDSYQRKLYLRGAAIWGEMVDNQNDVDKLNELEKEQWLLSKCKSVKGFSKDLEGLDIDIKKSTDERWELLMEINQKITFRPYQMKDYDYKIYCESYK
tara:strand:- start:460 stop:1029 length:570 start_codon:yes stop_codon:yes gene_type:complete